MYILFPFLVRPPAHGNCCLLLRFYDISCPNQTCVQALHKGDCSVCNNKCPEQVILVSTSEYVLQTVSTRRTTIIPAVVLVRTIVLVKRYHKKNTSTRTSELWFRLGGLGGCPSLSLPSRSVGCGRLLSVVLLRIIRIRPH